MREVLYHVIYIYQVLALSYELDRFLSFCKRRCFSTSQDANSSFRLWIRSSHSGCVPCLAQKRPCCGVSLIRGSGGVVAFRRSSQKFTASLGSKPASARRRALIISASVSICLLAHASPALVTSSPPIFSVRSSASDAKGPNIQVIGNRMLRIVSIVIEIRLGMSIVPEDNVSI